MTTPITVLDFETYYDKDFSLKKLSYPEYIMDPRFKVHGLGISRIVDMPRHSYGTGSMGHELDFVAEEDIPSKLEEIKNDIVGVHNGFFDLAILAWRYNFRPKYIIDSLSLANHVLGPTKETGGRNDLDSLAERLGLPVRKHDLSFMLGVRDPTPGDLLKLQEYLFADLSMTRLIIDKLLPSVSNRDFELWLMDHTLRIYTDRRLQVDVNKIEATMEMAQARRSERVKASGVNNAVLASNKQFAEELKRRLEAADIPLPLKKNRAGKMIPALAKGDAEFMVLAESSNPSVSNLVRGRLVERSAATTIARMHTMKKFAEAGIPVHLVYYGAHTGRFSGGGGFNFQNLTSPDRAVDPVDREIAAAIRESVVAGEGYVFVAADAAQIEARGVAWLAGEEWILEAYAAGADLYSQFISEVLGEDIHKPTENDPPKTHHHLKLMRQVGKEAILGLGFNMGVDKYMATLRAGGAVKSPDLARWVREGGITVKMAAGIVRAYREKSPKIVKLWDDYNDAFQTAYRGGVREVGPVKFAPLRDGLVPGRAVSITLPSSRMLYYRSLRMRKRTGTTTYTDVSGKAKTIENKGTELIYGNGHKVYGGLITENVTQAWARDILVEAIYSAEQAGYSVGLTIHDEVVVRVGVDQGSEALGFLNGALSTPPVWAPGAVLSAEGRVSTHLGK